MARKVLLICGIVAPVYYAAINVFVPMQWEGYSLASHTVSELSAIGAPTRALWNRLGPVYSLLIIAFGWGVWKSAKGNRPLRVVGGLMLAHGLAGLYWPPMHMRGAGFALTDALHIVWSMVTVILMMFSIGFAAAAFGKRFRLYSIATLITLFAFGVLTAMDGPRIAANQPTPWVGVWERISIAAFMIWLAVLAITILRAENLAVRSAS